MLIIDDLTKAHAISDAKQHLASFAYHRKVIQEQFLISVGLGFRCGPCTEA